MLSQLCKMPQEGLRQSPCEWWKPKHPLVLYYTFVSGAGPAWWWRTILPQPTCKRSVGTLGSASSALLLADVWPGARRLRTPVCTGSSIPLILATQGILLNALYFLNLALRGYWELEGNRNSFFHAWEHDDFKIYTDIRAKNKCHVLQKETGNIPGLVILSYTSNPVHWKALNFKQ